MVSPQPARAPTHHEAQAVGEPGCCVQGQQGPASCEAGVGGPPQQPQGGTDRALAGEGGSQQAQLRLEAEGEEPAQGRQGAAWGPARPGLVLVLAGTGQGGHIEQGHHGRQEAPRSPLLGPPGPLRGPRWPTSPAPGT